MGLLLDTMIAVAVEKGTEAFLSDNYFISLQVNELRHHMFTKKGKMPENIPPTSNSLLQHIRRAIFQGVFIWSKATEVSQNLPDAQRWGWEKVGDKFLPRWMTIPEAAKICTELIHCGCKKGCAARCKCSDLACTPLCFCDGDCGNNN